MSAPEGGLSFILTQNWRELGKRNPRELDFEVFVARIIFDRNSQARFHKPMLAKAVAKTTVHRIVHGLRPSTCQATQNALARTLQQKEQPND